ncbi:MAG: DUF255 domain-containing protein [Bacteroidota bacterium]
MRTALFISALAFLGLCFTLPAALSPAPKESGIQWITFAELAKKQKSKPRKVFIDVYTDWCGWCKKMEASTFKNPVIVKYMNENYYSVRFNAESKDPIEFNGKKYTNTGGTHQLASFLLSNKLSYPTTVYLNDDLSLIQAVPGYLDAKTFEMVVKYFGEEANKTIPWPDYQQTFVGEVK